MTILVALTIGRPRVETSKSKSIGETSMKMETSTKKRPLSACEEAIYSCCSSSKSNFVQSARCFEINNCPGINFITNPCSRLSSVIDKI